MKAWLFEELDNSPLIAFRAFFGFVLLCECAGAVATGWVTATYVDAPFTFSMIGFGWVLHPPGRAMYAYYFVMAGLAGLVMAGVRYRLSLAALTLMWGAAHVMQLARYNNHHYLMLLVCGLLWFCPADRRLAWDLRARPERREWTCPRWCMVSLAAMMVLVYVYGGIAKLDGDWLAGKPLAIWFAAKTDYPLIGPLYGLDWLPGLVAKGGLAFDLGIVPLLLWRRSRPLAIAATGVFHAFNAITFGVGMFPVLGFGFALFFVEPRTVGRWAFRAEQSPAGPPAVRPTGRQNLTVILLGLFFLIQLVLPLRHWAWPGHPSWTEEGHRMAWRMMLRSKAGRTTFRVVDPKTQQTWTVRPADRLGRIQAGAASSQPPMMWRFARYLADDFAAKGHPGVRVFVDSKVSLNGRPEQPIVDPEVDLAAEPWRWLQHAPWILPLRR